MEEKLPAVPAELPEPVSLPRPEKPGVLPDDAMSEAGRKVLRFHFARMLSCEEGTRRGEDIECLHDMRVATRRMRAALDIFRPYWDPEAFKPVGKGLRRAGRILGAVRDLDVLLQKVYAYLQTLPEEERDGLAPLLAAWQTQREQARDKMIRYLDSARYRDFVAAMETFLARTEALPPASDEPMPMLVAHVAPMVIYQRLGEMRAFEPFLADALVTRLHLLRIACERLRYTLEFFAEVLGPETKGVLKEMVALQDYLGALQDAVVATELLRAFVNEWAERQKEEPALQRVGISGVTRYLATRQAELHELLAKLPAAWRRLEEAQLRQGIACAVSVL